MPGSNLAALMTRFWVMSVEGQKIHGRESVELQS